MSAVQIKGQGRAFTLSIDGRDLRTMQGTYDQAITMAHKLETAARRKRRPCLGCKTSFTSTGHHHRFCRFCRAEMRAMG
ncbi:hypothetical protein [Oceaniglobus trochenteri]|uniref:hypothetical protein n=1 Tax=Oceaniglobus trochenteri TaxID=2763260 RepID=UPI001CFF586C|nr:hypothetical protein [Oceaniglobus trochenteri]